MTGTKLTVEEGTDQRRLRSRQSYSLAISDDAEDEDGVSEDGKDEPDLEEDEAGPLEQLQVEGDVDGADCLVAVADE